jgi:hypothetical protein
VKLLSVMLLTLSFNLHAVTDYCESAEVKSTMSSTDECRALTTTNKVENFQKICSGILMDVFACAVVMVKMDEGSAMNITCKTADGKEVLNQDMEAEASSFTQSAVISNAAGVDRLMTDNKSYLMISNPGLDVMVDGANTVIGLNLESQRTLMTSVTCK